MMISIWHYETLINKRQKNIQEQNFIRKFEISRTAKSFGSGDIPTGIKKLLTQKGMNINNSALVSFSAYPECCAHTYSGIIISADHKLY